METSFSHGLAHSRLCGLYKQGSIVRCTHPGSEAAQNIVSRLNDREPFMLGPTAAKMAWLRGCPARGPWLQDGQGTQLSLNSVRLPKAVLSKLCFLIHTINLNR